MNGSIKRPRWILPSSVLVLALLGFTLAAAPASVESGPTIAVEDETQPVPVPPASPLAIRYHTTGDWLWLLGEAWSILVLVGLLVSGVSGQLQRFAERIGRRWVISVAIYAFVLTLLLYALELPLHYYRGFIRQHAYGLSNQTFAKWFGDSVKATLISACVGALVAWVPLRLIQRSPRTWWLWTTLLSLPFLFCVVLLKPIWVDPLFNEFGSMKNQVLEAEILELAGRVGIHEQRVFEVEKSVDTKAVNAYVTGLLGTKRIVLWNTLLDQLSDREVLVVMGHEIGHYVLGHVPRTILLSSLLTLTGLVFTDRLGRSLIARHGSRFGFSQLSDLAALPLILLLIQLASLGLAPIGNLYSRYQETEADRFALELTRSNAEAAHAFIKIQQTNLAVPYPSLFHRIWRGTHPSIGERIDFCNRYYPWREGRPLKYSTWMHR